MFAVYCVPNIPIGYSDMLVWMDMHFLNRISAVTDKKFKQSRKSAKTGLRHPKVLSHWWTVHTKCLKTKISLASPVSWHWTVKWKLCLLEATVHQGLLYFSLCWSLHPSISFQPLYSSFIPGVWACTCVSVCVCSTFWAIAERSLSTIDSPTQSETTMAAAVPLALQNTKKTIYILHKKMALQQYSTN